MSQVDRIKELTAELLQHCHEYYDLDAPTISDAEYDKKYDELLTLENAANFWLANSPTRKVQGSVLDGFTKVEHSKPMLSAAKTKDINEIKKFLGNNDFYCSYKLDGLTLVTRYKNGEFVQAVTRGTGIIGEDVTEQAKMIKNLPMSIPYNRDLELRGECVIAWEDFHNVNEKLETPYSHPRNLAAGSLRNLDTNITKERNLSYIVFECVDGIDNDNKWMKLEALQRMGFEVVNTTYADVDDCIASMRPEFYRYPVDGLIFELNNEEYAKSLSSTAHHESCRMALKWADATYETTLLDVEWGPTRTGLIAPTAVFSPVDLDGAITTRSTLHNLSIIKQLELGIGDMITVYRSNMVIPKIDDNLTRSNTLAIPNKCPCCGSETIVKDTDNSQVLMCPNQNCSAKKVAQFVHFVSRKCMNIENLSEATLEKLISLGYINDFKGIYGLSKFYDQLIEVDGLGPKSVEKLLLAIEKSRNVRLENFIAALGIPNIGLSAAKTIATKFNHSFDDWMDAYSHGFPWDKLDDFGETMANNLDDYLDWNYKSVVLLADEMNFILPEKHSNNSLEGLKFCITGSFSQPRDTLKNQLEARGAKFVSSVSKNLDVLFAGDKAGSKLIKAQTLGVKVADETELMALLSK
jgi:DNA ligase (NAD+)